MMNAYFPAILTILTAFSFLCTTLIFLLASKRLQVITKTDYKTLLYLSSFCTLYAQRIWFIEKLDVQIDGVRYLGAGSAHIMNKEFAPDFGAMALTAEQVSRQGIEDLWKTSDGKYFLFKCVFCVDGLKSKLDGMHIVSLTHEAALLWVQDNAQGRTVPLLLKPDTH